MPDHLEFPLGYAAAVTAHPALLLAFIDLQKSDHPAVPNIYFVPSEWMKENFAPWVHKVKMWRWHPPIETAKPFKNNWSILTQLLGLEQAVEVETAPEDKVEINSSLEQNGMVNNGSDVT